MARKEAYKAIISDIDGTLTPIADRAMPSPAVIQAVKDTLKTGIIFSMATGRPYFLVKYLVELLGITSPLITDNGAAIVEARTGDVLWEASVPKKEAGEILALLQPYPLWRISTGHAAIENPSSIPEGTRVRKISVHDLRTTEADKLTEQLKDRYKDLSVGKASSYKGPEFIDLYIAHAEATKQHAVFKFAELVGISTKDIIGIGDAANDFPLFMACGLKVAMGNAVPELKEIADYIAPPVDEDGVVDVLRKYVLPKE